jgi:prophage antirepressor-like protein
MSNVIPFKFEAREVRTLLIDDQPWFVASDVARALEYRDAGDLTRNLDDDEADTHIMRTSSANGVEQTREMLIINESGLYSAILRSRKAEAKRFKKWVTAEVLPSIRKTGGYHVAANGEFTQGAIREFQSSRAEILEGIVKVNASIMALGSAYGLQGNQLLLYTNKAVEKQTGVAPMALLGITGLVNQEQELHYTATELGKKHSMSANSMNKLLAQVGLQRRFEYAQGKHRWELTPEGRKHGVILDTAKRHSDGTPVQQIRWRESVLQVLQGLARQLQATLPAVARG